MCISLLCVYYNNNFRVQFLYKTSISGALNVETSICENVR